MPAWQGTLTATQIDTLANFVVTPYSEPGGPDLFRQYCSQCHGQQIPAATNVDEARNIIATGGAHQTMPVWGNVLTQAQIDALVSFVVSSAQGTSVQRGQTLFAQNCAICHGDFGEGGPNPSQPNQIIPPIGTANFLSTFDDTTLFQIISQGQPDKGMSPFGSADGGSLDVDRIRRCLSSFCINLPTTAVYYPPYQYPQLRFMPNLCPM
jgi:mono/diheme cytochrome c family protein